MPTSLRVVVPAVAVLWIAAATRAAPAPPESLLLADFSGDAKTYQVAGSRMGIVDGALHLGGGPHETASATVTPANSQAWNLFAYTRVVLDVENAGDATVHLHVRVENPDALDYANSAVGDGFVPPHTRKPYNVDFFRRTEDLAQFPQLNVFTGMKCLPGGFQPHWQTIDAADVRRIVISASSDAELKLTVRSLSAASPMVPKELREKGDAFFPFVDKYGQYRWSEWDGKITSDEQLRATRDAERDDLASHPRPANWDEWGGWQDGPQLPPGKFFRVEKNDGRWWLVTPAGHLFFSHGANCVGFDSASTRVSGRERYFTDLPARDGTLGFAWSRDGLNFDHLQANLGRIFGNERDPAVNRLAQDRLASWGMNTIGAWSDGNITVMRRTPYTAIVHPGYAQLVGAMPDVYDPNFVDKVRFDVKKGLGEAAGDPWCIGMFVDNELKWGNDPLDLVATILGTPPQRFTKVKLIDALRSKLDTIESYNRAAGTKYKTWDELLASREEVKAKQIVALRDATGDFYAQLAERYFKTCADAVHEAAPGQLYLGCRFNLQNRALIAIASKHCDVISFNRYEHSVESFDGYGTDRPILISEFHFGALDAGMLGTGLRAASDRYDRAAKYQAYVEGARRNPRIVGTHWFAFCPQSITGRFDGENFNIGLFDVCNQPYPEMRDAMRAVAAQMYR